MLSINSYTAQQRQAELLASQSATVSKAPAQPTPNAQATTPSSVVSISSQAYSLQRADTTAPKVVKFSPADGKNNVSVTANISVKFSEAIQRGTGNIILKDAEGTVIETFNAANSNRITISGKTLKIDPTDDFELGKRYFVTFAPGTIRDLSGNAYAGTETYDFRTKLDKKKPTVTGFYPGNGATGVAPSANLTLTFSEMIRAGSGQIKIVDSNKRVVEAFSASSSQVSINGNTLTLDPNIRFDLNARYKIVIDKGAIKDLAGNAFKGVKSYSFQTSPIDIPYTPPTIPGAITSYNDNPQDASRFNIALSYTGDTRYLTYFQQARTIWENIIIGDLPSYNGIDDLKITASVTNIDGPGRILGQAGPTLLRSSTYLPIQGNMKFDSADMASMVNNGTLLGVVLHEMGHVLGFGTLWGLRGFNSTFGQYTGPQALATYKTMTNDATKTYVPLETGGGAGTANAHWLESLFDRELMTGYAESDSNMPLSILTVRAMQDLGYQVDISRAETYTLPT